MSQRQIRKDRGRRDLSHRDMDPCGQRQTEVDRNESSGDRTTLEQGRQRES